MRKRSRNSAPRRQERDQQIRYHVGCPSILLPLSQHKRYSGRFPRQKDSSSFMATKGNATQTVLYLFILHSSSCFFGGEPFNCRRPRFEQDTPFRVNTRELSFHKVFNNASFVDCPHLHCYRFDCCCGSEATAMVQERDQSRGW